MMTIRETARTPEQKARQAAWYRNKYATNPEFRQREIARCSNGWTNPQRALSQNMRRLRASMVRKREQIAVLEEMLRAMGVPSEGGAS